MITATEYALPTKCVTNDELDRAHPDWFIHKLAVHTGVFTRYVCTEDETALDLATTACERLFKRSDVAREEIDSLIFCTQSADYVLPPNATLLQERLGLPVTVAAFDYSLACSGFIYGLMIGRGLIESDLSENVLLITADTYSRYVNPGDRGTMALFGDGAAATLLRKGRKGISDFVMGTDGSGGQRFIVPAGGARIPKSIDTGVETRDSSGNIRALNNIHMDGLAILRFVKDRIPDCVKTLLTKTGTSWNDISLVISHQGSALSLDVLQKALEIPDEKMYRNIARVGNTVSASIPIAIRDAQLEGRVIPGSRLLLVGFGVGYSWGACLVDL